MADNQKSANALPRRKKAALSTFSGKSPSEIASAEAASEQAVAKSAPEQKVRYPVRDLILYSRATEERNGVETTTTFLEGALATLYKLLEAKKAVPCGGFYAMEPDNAVRLAAALAIVELYEPTQPAVVFEESVIEETATRRVARRRSAG